MVECPKCHSENKKNSRFCSNCAAPLSAAGIEGASLTKTLVTPPPAISKDTVIASKYKIIAEVGAASLGGEAIDRAQLLRGEWRPGLNPGPRSLIGRASMDMRLIGKNNWGIFKFLITAETLLDNLPL